MQGMQPQPLENNFLDKIWASLGEIWANLGEIWAKFEQIFEKI